MRREPGIAVLAVAALAWVFVMGLAVWRRHDRYGTFDLDIGFHTQLIWQLARGRSFSTILGLHAFAHNATFGYFLLVPFSWLGLVGPQSLDLLQTVVVASAVVPVHVLARRRLGTGWPAVVVALAWLLHPIVQNTVWETFHPEVIAAVLLLWAYVAADEGRWRRYWVFVLLAIIWKSDVALFVAMLGVWVAVRRSPRVGKQTVALGVVWFAVIAGIVIPRASGGETVYGALYGDLGDTPTEVALNSVTHPSRLYDHVVNARPVGYGLDLVVPFGGLPVLAPLEAALALPQYALPFGVRWNYYWSEDGDPLRAAKDAAVAMVGPSASVSSHYLFTAHFATRELAYTFPNPWVKQFYGVDSTAAPDPAEVEWVVLDEGVMSDLERDLATCIASSGAFETVLRDGDIVVLRRLIDIEPTDLACR